MSKIIKLKNEEAVVISILIKNVELDDKKSCSRRRFLRSIKPIIEEFDLAKQALQIKYGSKKEDGELVVKNGQVEFLPEKKREFEVAFTALSSDENIIDVTPANEADIETIITILKDLTAEFIQTNKEKFTAENYDYLCAVEESVVALTPTEITK